MLCWLAGKHGPAWLAWATLTGFEWIHGIAVEPIWWQPVSEPELPEDEP